MDMGPQWPFWMQGTLALTGGAFLVLAAWRHASAPGRWPAAAMGLAGWWSLAILSRALEAPLCQASSITLPGCDWEYHRAPTEPRELFYFILMGGIFLVFRLGSPVAALVFTVRRALPRLRPRGPRPPAMD